MKSPLKSAELESLGVLRARGADAVAFLQGQLSNDIAKLSAAHSLLAGYHNPQGRTIAVLRLLEYAPGDVLVLLPRELVATVIARLSRFILRSKVKLTDESAAWSVHGLLADGPGVASDPTATVIPPEVNTVARSGAALIARVTREPLRALLVQPREQAAVLADVPRGDESSWHAGAIAAAEPQVFAATSEEFVAQMLNLDAIGAIAFDKGCYTGQEVIARAHYRGRVKRRLQRFVTRDPVNLSPGASFELPDGRGVKVVDAIQRSDGRCEFLGVTAVADEEAEAGAAATTTARATSALDAQALPMPYPLPQ